MGVAAECDNTAPELLGPEGKQAWEPGADNVPSTCCDAKNKDSGTVNLLLPYKPAGVCNLCVLGGVAPLFSKEKKKRKAAFVSKLLEFTQLLWLR